MKSLSATKKLRVIFSIFIIIITGFFSILFFNELIKESSVKGATFIVGTDQSYTTINAALAVASNGDTIRVYAGTYYENLTIFKSISLIANGTQNTTIQATTYDNVLKIRGSWVNISGFTIKTFDPDSSQAGAELPWLGNIKIENCNFSNCYYGIRIKSKSNTIKNNTFYNNYIGVSLEHFNTKLENNTFINNDFGIYCSGTRYHNILNNTFYNCSIYLDGYHLECWNSHVINENNLVNGKRIYYLKNKNDFLVPSNAGQVIIANSTNIKVEKQNLTNGSVGICIGHSTNIKLKNNNISGNKYGIKVERSDNNIFEDLDLCFNDMGIYIERVSDNKFNNNTISYNSNRGIYDYYSSDNVYSNNLFLKNGYGLYQGSSSNTKIIKNDFISNSYMGIDIYYSDNFIIQNNNVSSSQYGIYLDTSSNNIVRFNEITKNFEGFKFHGMSWSSPATMNIITQNNISSNTNVGLWFYHYTENNYVYYNNFLDNYHQAMDYGSGNKWNNSDQEGNYWSDYTGLDNGVKDRIAGDGIGDTNIPHPSGEHCDYYPFIRKDGWLYPGRPILVDPGEICINKSFRLTWSSAKRASGYILEESLSADFAGSKVIYTGPNTSIRIEKNELKQIWYRVKAYNEYYLSQWSNGVDIIIDRLPEVPKDLAVDIIPEGESLKISWTTNKNNTNEYWLYFMESYDWELLNVLKHPINNYTHTGLQNGKIYYYKLRASNFNELYSEFTEIVYTKPQDISAPTAPREFKIIETTINSISLSWKLNKEEDVKGYNIYRFNLTQDAEQQGMEGNTGSPPEQLDWGSPIKVVSKYTWKYTDLNLNDRTTYYYKITAFDEVPNESGFSNMVSSTTLLGQHPPFVNNSVSDFSILEDTTDESTIDLNHWFSDINHDMLKFRCEGNRNLLVKIDAEGMVYLKPRQDWNGFEILTFYANDSYSEVSDQVNVTVLPVNDPPNELSIKFDEFLVYYEGRNQPVWGNGSDPDIPYGDELTFSWFSNRTGKIGIGKSINLSLPTGSYQIILNVTDSANAYSTLIRELEIIQIPVTNKTQTDSDNDCYPDDIDAFPLDPTQWLDSDGDNYGDSPLGNNPDAYPYDPTRWRKDKNQEPGLMELQYFWLLIGVIISIVVIIIILLFYLRKKGQMDIQNLLDKNDKI